jgi:hypothetical protein
MEADGYKVIASMIDGDAAVIRSNIRSRAVSLEGAVGEQIAGKMFIQELARDISTLASKVEKGLDTTERALLIQRVQMLVDTTTALKGIQTQAARLTTAGRIRTGADAIPELLEALKKGGDNDAAIKDLAYKVSAAAGDPKAILRTVQTANSPIRIHNMIWRASLLANVDTHVVNTVSNFIHTAVMPVELAMGRFARGLLHGDLGAALRGSRDAFVMYAGMAKQFRDSVRMSYKVAISKEGDPILDAATKVDFDDQAQALIRLSDQRTAFSETLKWAGRFVKTPFRALATEDEFFKQIAYRGHVYSQLWREGLEKGLKGKQLAEFIETSFDKQFSPLGRALNEEALRYAQKATYTTPHPKGSLGETFQIVAARHPLVQATVAPFIKTPANLMRRVWDWTPGVNALHGEFRRALLDGSNPARQAEALGSLSFGAMLYGSAVWLAWSGMIEGAPSPKYDVQRNKTLAGDLGYSAVITDENGQKTRIRFNRIDPFASVLGFAADFVQAVRAGADEATLDEMAAMATMSLAQNLMSKTYMRGLSEMMEAIDSPGRMSRWLRNRAASYVPAFPSQIADTLGVGDPNVREVRDAWDAIMARIPGLSSSVPPRVNWLTGDDQIKPQGALLPEPSRVFLTGTEADKHPAMIELGRINFPGRPPAAMIGNVKLSPEQERRFRQLMAKPEGAKPMLDAMWDVMQSPRYQRFRDIDPEFYKRRFGEDDPRHDLIRTLVIDRYRRRAWNLLAKEDEVVREALQAENRNELRARAGRRDLNPIEEILQQNQR